MLMLMLLSNIYSGALHGGGGGCCCGGGGGGGGARLPLTSTPMKKRQRISNCNQPRQPQ